MQKDCTMTWWKKKLHNPTHLHSNIDDTFFRARRKKP